MKNNFVAQQANRTGGVKHQISRGEIKFQHGRTMKTSNTNYVADHNPKKSMRNQLKKDQFLKDRQHVDLRNMQRKQIAG